MIREAVVRWEKGKDSVREALAREHPESYLDLVKLVVKCLEPMGLDQERIVEIDQGEYSGVLVYVIGEKGYQPCKYWYVKVDYGSCSGCDTLEYIKSLEYLSNVPTEEQVRHYMTLALNLVQQLHSMQVEQEDV